jgi:hypothetical protein
MLRVCSEEAAHKSTTIWKYARKVAYCCYIVCDVDRSIEPIGTMGIYSSTEEAGAASP